MKNNKDPLYSNKIAGALLIGLLVVLGIGYIGNGLYHIDRTSEAYPIEVAEVDNAAAGAEEATETALPEIGPLLVSASAENGEANSKRCISCHSFEKGGPNKVGPNLWNVLGADIAIHADYKYSDALMSIEGNWDIENMNKFLASPKTFAKGNKMSFIGLSKEQDRADMIKYLHGQSDNPIPLP